MYKKPYKITVSLDGTGDYETLEAALQSVKALQCDKDVLASYDAIYIALSSGTHAVKEPITIDADIATGKLPIVIEGVSPLDTVLSGGIEFVGGWTEYKDGIYKKQLCGVKKFRQLYVNDNVAIRARYPNDTGDLTGDYMRLTWNEDVATHNTLGCVGIPSSAKNDLTDEDIQGAELHFVQEWTQSVGHIWKKEITQKEDVLYFGFQQDWFTRQLFARPYPIRNSVTNRCWLENSLAFLDAEREWYFDYESQTLYYKPTKGTDIQTLTFTIPQAENIFKIIGTPKAQAQGVAISKLTIANTNWTYASEDGYIDGQAGLFYGQNSGAFDRKSTSAGVYTFFAKDVTVSDCIIKNMGAYGVDFHVGTKRASLINSTIDKTAGSGVNIGTYGEEMPKGYENFVTVASEPKTEVEITEEVTVYNCLIQNVGTAFKGGSTGIVAGFVRKITLEQNTITNVSYSGIAVGWGWEHYNSVLSDIKINRNRITNVMNHLPFDGGPIYLLSSHVPTENGSEIIGNYMEASGLAGIYFDCSSSLYKTKDNVIKGVGKLGAIDLHDWNYLLRGISVTNTYTNLPDLDNGVFRHNYWSGEDWKGYTNPPPTPESREVFYEQAIYAYQDGKWSAEAQAIIDKAGKK